MLSTLARPSLALAFALFVYVTAAPLAAAYPGTPLFLICLPFAALTAILVLTGDTFQKSAARGCLSAGAVIGLLPLLIWWVGPQAGAYAISEAGLFLSARAIGTTLSINVIGIDPAFFGLGLGALLGLFGLTRGFVATVSDDDWSAQLSRLVDQHNRYSTADRKRQFSRF